jgi:hypothetical protein
MAKVTLSFKGRQISIHRLGERPVTIGRDSDCDIPIDSLAIGPRHALITAHPDGYSLAAANPEYSVVLNNEKVDQAALHHGDLIRIGKHTLHFAEEACEAAQEVAVMPAPPQANAHRDAGAELAYVQVQSGPDLGRVFALHGDSMRLTLAGANRVVITRRKSGYFLLCDDPDAAFGINGKPAPPRTEVPLPDAAVIEVDKLRCQFFCTKWGAA